MNVHSNAHVCVGVFMLVGSSDSSICTRMYIFGENLREVAVCTPTVDGLVVPTEREPGGRRRENHPDRHGATHLPSVSASRRRKAYKSSSVVQA